MGESNHFSTSWTARKSSARPAAIGVLAPDVLAYTHGLPIADVDHPTVHEAVTRLPVVAVAGIMQQLTHVGLGHLRLGQPLTTLSGGECQRIKIAKEMRDSAFTTYLLDEPTTGLHLLDIDTLLHILDSLVDQGHVASPATRCWRHRSPVD